MARKMQNWTVSVDDCKINVASEKSGTVVQLSVNDKVQDVELSLFRVHLYGKTPNGKEIKVVFGGLFITHCYIFVDNELVFQE